MILQFINRGTETNCQVLKKLLNRVKKKFPGLVIEDINVNSPRGKKLVEKYNLIVTPGIAINGNLVLSGEINETDLIKVISTNYPPVSKS